MQLIEEFIKNQGGDIVGSLTSKLGLGEDQAKGLLSTITSQMSGLLGGGDLNPADLLGGDGLSAILGKLNLGQIASESGVTEDQARDGVAEVANPLLGWLGDKAGDADGLMSMLGGSGDGGLMGNIGGIAGSFLKGD